MPTFVAVSEVMTEKVRVEWTLNDWYLIMRFSDMDDNETSGPVIKLKHIPKCEFRLSIAAISKLRSEEAIVPQISIVGSEIYTNSLLLMGTIGLYGPQKQDYGGSKIDRLIGLGEVIGGTPVLKNKIQHEKLIVVADMRVTIKKPDKFNPVYHSEKNPNRNADGDFGENHGKLDGQMGSPDLIIRVGEGSFKAHKSILASKSRVLKSMIDQAAAANGKRKNVIEISNTNPEIWERLQNYLYNGYIHFEKEHLDDTVALLVLADRYQISTLTEELADKLKLIITKYNVLDIFDIAEHFNLIDLERKSMNFLKLNSEFFKTDKAEGMRKRLWNNPKLAELMFTRM